MMEIEIDVDSVLDYTSKAKISAIDKGLLNFLTVAYQSNKEDEVKRVANIIYGRIMSKMVSFEDEITDIVKGIVVENYQPLVKVEYIETPLEGSLIDINNHEAFDASNVSNCANCNLPLTHKKSVTIALGPWCSGLNYSNEVDWNIVIDKLTTGKGGMYARGPKYVVLQGGGAGKIVHVNGQMITLKFLGDIIHVPKWAVVYIPQMKFKKFKKINEDKRMSKNNRTAVEMKNAKTLLIQTKFIAKAPKVRAFLRLMTGQRIVDD